MKCFNCTKEVSRNELMMLDQDDYDQVVDWFSLIHLTGPKEQFDEMGNVVICEDCIDQAL